jgi:hypothetical protein
VKSVKRSHGEEGVYLKDGRKLLYKTRTKGGGRGFSADLLILDEAMFIAEAFLGALMPVISARPNPQMWYTGSAVDQEKMEHGIVFARLRERALVGKAGRMAYLGWSPAYERKSDGSLLWEPGRRAAGRYRGSGGDRPGEPGARDPHRPRAHRRVRARGDGSRHLLRRAPRRRRLAIRTSRTRSGATAKDRWRHCCPTSSSAR